MKFFIDIPSTPIEWIEYLYPNDMALALNQVPNDTAIWYTVQGVYTPDSAYTHLLLGNFRPDSLSAPTELDSTGFSNSPYAYAFIDEVCAAYDPSVCGIVQIAHEISAPRLVRVATPFRDELIVWFSSPPVGTLRRVIADSAGRIVSSGSEVVSSSIFRIQLPETAAGLYLLMLSDAAGSYAPQRVVRETP